MNRKHYAAVSAGALLAATGSQVQADTTVPVSVSHAAAADYSVFFPEVMDATDLVSISSGATVNTGEGSGRTMTIEVIYEDENNVDQYFQIYSGAFSGAPLTVNPLSQFTGNNYTAFNGPLDVKGLRIESGGSIQQATLFLPSNTILTFAVPEPTVTGLIFAGLLLMASRRNGVYR